VLALVAFFAALLIATPAQTAPSDIADLAVTKTDSPDPVTVGATLTYTIVVTNNGPQEATNVFLSDRLPSHSDFVSATATGARCEGRGNNVSCNLGNLAKAATATVTIVVRPTRAGTLENSASVDSPETDPVPLNDSATVTTQVLAAPRTGSCRGVEATIVGTAGADNLTGTSGPDVIAAFRGNDAIAGLGGRDLICAGAGNDQVAAGSAADRAFGGGGADRMLGSGGPDLLAGNAGADVLRGDRGNDRLRGGRGFDRCFGGAGLDRLRGCES
jgi:uncharacterized repeat protein (TIGR01451 family)